jgi:putative transposase
VLDRLLYVWHIHNIKVGTDSRYSKNAGAVFSLKYHIVWCPKYRKKVLVGDVEIRTKNVLYATAAQYGVLIETMEVMPDHVHLFVSSDPTRCVAEIVNRLKGASSRILREEFPHLKSRLPTLWSRSYYAGTVGHVSEATVAKYIENQKGR